MSDVQLRQTPDGTYYIRPYLGRSAETGKPIRPYKEFPGMDEDAATLAAREFVTHARETLLSESNGLQAQLGLYLDNAAATKSLQPNSIRQYRYYTRRYAKTIGAMPVGEVTAATIDNLTRDLIQKGPANGRPLARSTVRAFQQYLRGAYNYFVAMGLADHNPVKESMKIRVDTTEAEPLDETAMIILMGWIRRTISEDCEGERGILRRNAAVCILMALKTGMRIGELCALRRKDVRIAQKTISVNGTTQGNSKVRQNETKGHRVRNISISRSDCETILEHERWQVGYLPECNQTTPLFTLDGTHMTPENMRYQFRRMQRETGIDSSYHFHSLRHTHATYLLANGYDMQSVSQRLGHADVKTTMTIYSHVLPAYDTKLSNGMDEILSAF